MQKNDIQNQTFEKYQKKFLRVIKLNCNEANKQNMNFTNQFDRIQNWINIRFSQRVKRE